MPIDCRQARSLLRQALADPQVELRDGQWEAIDAIANRRKRLLLIQRTGWGKSSVYFLSTRILCDAGAGPTLIVSPLLALMRNQIAAAERLGLRAVRIDSTNREEWPVLHERVVRGEVDVLLVSPERLANDEFVEGVLARIADRIGLLVVDEAHCISDWGHDFRPDYRRLANILRRIPATVPILATTATANDRVVEDVCGQLGAIEVVRGPLLRESLALQTLRLPDQAARLAWLAAHVPALPGSGVVYVFTKRDADQVAAWLRQSGIDARAYYSDVSDPAFPDSNAYREHLEDLLLEDRVKALVATTALGMGYDKPNLGFVIHFQAPGSLVAYYQQVGRAGRAIAQAVGVLLSGREDEDIHEFFRESAFPDEAQVDRILEALADSDGLSERDLEERVNLRQGQIRQVLKLLSVDNPAPVVKDGSIWLRTPIDYRMAHDRIARLTSQREAEWAEVQGYLDERGCLMQALAGALDDETCRPCGRCERCTGRPVVPPGYPHALASEAARFLRRAELPLECRVQVAAGAFTEYGFHGNLPVGERAETGRILSRWGDAGWGAVVREDKHAGRFRDELVEAVAEMIRERWQPAPAPEWVACVPSLAHPDLVPDLARGLAGRLGVPFLPLVEKVRPNEPQKLQQNRYRQCANLDGVFAVRGDVPAGPVLLLDDIVDSGWTLTVVAALLRRAGSGPVFPLALATSGGD